MGAMSPLAAAAPGGGSPDKRLSFLLGTRVIWKPIATIAVTPGQSAPQLKVLKNGWLGLMRHRITGKANVTGAGSAGTPKLHNVIDTMKLSLSGNYEYRNLDGDSYMVRANAQHYGSADAVFNDPSYANYDPTSVSNQTVNLLFDDDIWLNAGVNADEFLLPAQARNYDLTFDVKYGTAADIAANTEVMVPALTHYIEGAYYLDPDYNKYAPPDTGYVQQIIQDKSFNNVVVGENVVPVTPINGPELMQLFIQPKYNNVIDAVGVASATTRFRLRVNNGQDILDLSAQALASSNYKQWGRKLPLGYYCLDFLNDLSLVNAMSQFRTKILSTATLNQLELYVTVAAGTVTTNSVIKLVKRFRNPAVS